MAIEVLEGTGFDDIKFNVRIAVDEQSEAGPAELPILCLCLEPPLREAIAGELLRTLPEMPDYPKWIRDGDQIGVTFVNAGSILMVRVRSPFFLPVQVGSRVDSWAWAFDRASMMNRPLMEKWLDTANRTQHWGICFGEEPPGSRGFIPHYDLGLLWRPSIQVGDLLASESTIPQTVEMQLEIHFHEQGAASVILESTATGALDLVGEATLLALYTARQLVNLGGNEARSLAQLLTTAPQSPETLAQATVIGGVRLVPYQGSPGRKRFSARMSLGDNLSIHMDAHGFGWFGQGVGYYTPTSVVVLLRHLLRLRLGDSEQVGKLARIVASIGLTHLTGQLTIANQQAVALSAVQGSAHA